MVVTDEAKGNCMEHQAIDLAIIIPKKCYYITEPK